MKKRIISAAAILFASAVIVGKPTPVEASYPIDVVASLPQPVVKSCFDNSSPWFWVENPTQCETLLPEATEIPQQNLVATAIEPPSPIPISPSPTPEDTLTPDTPTTSPTDTPTPDPVSPTPQPLSPTSPPQSPASLDADALFALINNHRAQLGLPPFQKDDRICQVATSRAPEIYNEVFVNGNMHAGFYARHLPYSTTENIIYIKTIEEALNWWLNSPIHRAAIEGNYKYSCIGCSGTACSQVFANF